MATKFQIKRTSVSGRTPNTTNSANSSYIAAGELALNLTDKKMYSSNGTNYFEIGAFKVELVNSTSNVSTFTEISTLQFDEDSGFDITNPSAGVAKVAMNSTFKYWQVNGTTQLTATGLDTVNFISGDNITITANGANTPQSIAFSTSLTPTFTRITVGNSTVNTVANSTSITTKQIYANGAFGTTGQVLTSNGSGMYWSDKVDSTFTVTSETFTANGTATQFTLSQPTTSLETFVFLNGVAQIPTTDYSISNVTLTFVAPPANNDEVEVRIIDIPQINGVDIKLDSFVGNGSNTVYTLSTSLSSNTTTFVYLNGVAQVPTVDYGVSGSTLTFITAPVNSELIRAVTINPVGNYASDSFTANSTVNNNFTLSIPTVTNRALVFINGVAQAPSIDYYVSGSTLTLTNNAAANDVVQVRSFFDEPSGSGANTTIQYNFSGRLKGSSGFTFNETTNNVTIANTLIVPNFILNASNPPSNSTSTGSTGTFAWDSSYFYIATGTNTWKKVPISTDGVVGSAITAGSNTEIQFNSSGALGANSNFRFDSAATLLTVGNSTVNTTVNSSAVTATKIIANGAFGSNGQVLTSNGTAMYWGTGGGGAGSGVGITRESFTGNGSNTNFTLSTEPIDETHLMVYVDRVIQRDPDYSVSGTTLTFAVAPDNGAEIDAYIMTDATQQVKGVKVNTFTGNGSNTQFTLGSSSSNAAYTLAFVDSVFQPTSEYTVVGTTLTFTTAPDNGVPIEVIQLGVGLVGDPQVAGANTEIQFNNSNAFGANNKFTFNPTTTTLALGSNVTINTSAIFIGNSSVNTTIIAGNINLQGTQLQVGNVVVNGNQLVVGNVTITDTQITVGNSTSNIVLGQTGSLSGNGSQLTSVNAIALQGNSVSDILVAANTAANTLAAAAFTNATSYADSRAATAYSNAISYADTKAATAYSNATSYADSAAATAFSNAVIRADAAYANAISYADTKAGQAFTNAAARADSAYSNAVAYAASNTYVNSTFLQLAGGTLTGNLTVNAAANVVGNVSANNATFRGDVQIDGNLTVSGTSVVINATSLAVTDNMIYLNNGSQVTDPDLGFAGNYNDGTYKHAGFFRDASDGIWKVYDSYLPEPDASAFIDTSNASFRIADFQANVVTMASASLTGTLTVKAISSNGSVGTAGQLLASNGTSTYWINPPASTNVDAQYTWTNNHTFTNSISFSNTVTVNNTLTVYSPSQTSGYTARFIGPARALTILSYYNQEGTDRGTWLYTTNASSSGYTNMTLTGNAVTIEANVAFDVKNLSTQATIAYFASNGNVGVGTASPSSLLNLRSSNPVITLTDSDTSASAYVDYQAGTSLKLHAGSDPLAFVAGNAEAGRFAANGNLGIGTTTPGYKLDVNGTTSVGYLRVAAQDGTNEGGEIQLVGAGSYGTFQIDNYQGNARLHTLAAGKVFEVLGGSIRAGVAGNSSANYAALQVAASGTGDAQAAIAIQQITSEGDTIIFADYEPFVEWGISTENTDNLVQFTGGQSGGSLVSKTLYNRSGDARTAYSKFQVNLGTGVVAVGGNMGIGTTAPTDFGGRNLSIVAPNNSTYASTLWVSNSYVLQALVNEASAVMSIGARSNHKLDLCTNDTTRVTILAGGNVGIGNTSPNAKLHVTAATTTAPSLTWGAAAGQILRNEDSELAIGLSTAAPYPLWLQGRTSTNGSREIVLNPLGGNVGIANSAPATKFHVTHAGSNGSTGLADYGILLTGNSGQATMGVIYDGDGYANFNLGSTISGTTRLWHISKRLSGANHDLHYYYYNGSTFALAYTFGSTGNLTVAGTLTESSSATIKENIDPIQNALGLITSLTGYTYDRKDGSAKSRAGLIAEEVEQVLPNVVQKDEDGNPSGIHYTNLIAYLVESIKELKQEIDILKGK